MKNLLATLVCTFFSVLSFAQQGWQKFDHEVYSVSYPETWEFEPSEEPGSYFFIFSPVDDVEDSFSENVNLVTEDLTGTGVNLDQYAELAQGQVEQVISEFNLIESKRIKGRDMSYHKIVYTGSIDGLALKFEQRFWIKDDTAYVLTLCCTVDTYKDFRDVGGKIMDSVKLN